MSKQGYESAHKRSSCHREEIMGSEFCGCFYCLQVFAPAEIKEWIEEEYPLGATALCPKCGIDSVIGTGSGYPVTREFLSEMHEHWFAGC